MSGIGHNGSPPLVSGNALQQIEAIVDSDRSATEKLVAVKIRLRVDARTLGGAYPSLATLAKAASVKDQRTVQAALDTLCRKDEQGAPRRPFDPQGAPRPIQRLRFLATTA